MEYTIFAKVMVVIMVSLLDMKAVSWKRTGQGGIRTPWTGQLEQDF